MQTVIVAGALGGIGGAVASNLLAQGYRVLAIDVAETNASETFDSTGSWRVRADVSDEAVVDRLFGHFQETAGAASSLVCATGSFIRGRLGDLSKLDWDRSLSDHILVPAICANAFIRHFRSGGRIVFVGSIAAYESLRGQASYSVGKAGLAALARSINTD